MYVFFVLIDIGIQVRLPLVDLSFSLYIKLININKKIKQLGFAIGFHRVWAGGILAGIFSSWDELKLSQ